MKNNEKDEATNASVTINSTDKPFFLIGLMNGFLNSFQAVADSLFKEISWKQCFIITCLQLFDTPPTLNELAEFVDSSHQNVKQILNKLESKKFVQMIPDPKDKRKQRIMVTDQCRAFCEKNDAQSQKMIAQLFEGIGEEQLLITIQTITQMERNLKKL